MGVVGGTRSHRESHTNNKKILPPQGSNLRLDAVRRDREKAGGGGWHMTPPSEIAFLFLFFYSYYFFFRTIVGAEMYARGFFGAS